MIAGWLVSVGTRIANAWKQGRLRALERETNKRKEQLTARVLRQWADDWQERVEDLEGWMPVNYSELREDLMQEARAKAIETHAHPWARPAQMSQDMWVALAVPEPATVSENPVPGQVFDTLNQTLNFGSPFETPPDVYVGLGVVTHVEVVDSTSVQEASTRTASTFANGTLIEVAQERLPRFETLSNDRLARLRALCNRLQIEFRPDGWPETLRRPGHPPESPSMGATWAEHDMLGATYHYAYDGQNWVCIEHRATARSARHAHGIDVEFLTHTVYSGTFQEVSDHIEQARHPQRYAARMAHEEQVRTREREARAERERRAALTASFATVAEATNRPTVYDIALDIPFETLLNFARSQEAQHPISTFTFYQRTVTGPDLCLAMQYLASIHGLDILRLIANLPGWSISVHNNIAADIQRLVIKSSSREQIDQIFEFMQDPSSLNRGAFNTTQEITVPTQPAVIDAQSKRRLSMSHKERKDEDVPHQQHQSDSNPVNRGITKRRKRAERQGD